jgi:hypothetical protein
MKDFDAGGGETYEADLKEKLSLHAQGGDCPNLRCKHNGKAHCIWIRWANPDADL